MSTKWISAVFFISLCFTSSASFAESFLEQIWTYDKFIAAFPDQADKAEAFHKIVRHKTAIPSSEFQEKALTISVIYPGNQASDYWRKSIASLEKRLKEAHINYKISSLFTESATEIRKQERFIQKSLQRNPDYLIFTLDALRHKKIVEFILGNSQTKVILQNITTPLKDWDGFQPFLYVGFDHQLGSQKLAQEFLSRVGKEGHYAVFYGPRGYVSRMRGNSFINIISKQSQLKLAASFYVGFNRQKSKETALILLQERQDLKFIYACSTDIALGIIDALEELGLKGKILVNGWGGGSAELEAIAKGDMDFTIMRMNDDNGVAMADAMILDQSGQADTIPQIFSGEMVVVTKDFTAGRIENLKNRAFRYSKETE